MAMCEGIIVGQRGVIVATKRKMKYLSFCSYPTPRKDPEVRRLKLDSASIGDGLVAF